MNTNNFTKEDKTKLIEFLNLVAKSAKFDEMNVQSMIEFVKLLGVVQGLIPKIEANILEVVKVVEAKQEAPAIPKV